MSGCSEVINSIALSPVEAEPTTVLPSSTVDVSITTKALAPVVISSEMATTPTTEVLSVQSIVIPVDDAPVEDIDCDDAENLCETGAYNCDDIADYCDYGPDDGQDLPDEFDWDE